MNGSQACMYGGWGEAGNSRNPDELLIEVQFFQAFMELKQIILIDVFFPFTKLITLD